MTVCLPACLIILLSTDTKLCHKMPSFADPGELALETGVAGVILNDDSGEVASVSDLVRDTYHTEAWR